MDLYVVVDHEYLGFPRHTVLDIQYDIQADEFDLCDCYGNWKTLSEKSIDITAVQPASDFQSGGNEAIERYIIKQMEKMFEQEVDEYDKVKKPNHYQLFPEYNLEVKDINKRLLDRIEDSDFDMTLYEAGWYQQAMQYFERFYAKNGLEDIEKGIQTMQFVLDSMKSREDDAPELDEEWFKNAYQYNGDRVVKTGIGEPPIK